MFAQQSEMTRLGENLERRAGLTDSKKALKLMRKYVKIHEHVTSEDRVGWDVVEGLSCVLREIPNNTANFGPFWVLFGWYRPAGSK